MIRLGIVDFDSSHSIEWTQRFNGVGVDPDQQVEGARVVLGCPGTSTMSPERIPQHAEQIRACGVRLVERPEQMLGAIDGVLILSLCGQVHLERVRPFLEAGVPAFVDKPFACSIADAAAMVQLAEQHGTFVLSASGMRFAEEIEQFHQRAADYGPLYGMVSYGPAKRAAGNPGLFHYGIHPTEVLFTMMGRGCTQVATVSNDNAEVVTGVWEDGRMANLRGLRRGATAYGFLAFCEWAVVNQRLSTRYSYRNLCREIVRSFEQGKPTIDIEDTLELVRFIVGSLQSEQQGGLAVRLAELH